MGTNRNEFILESDTFVVSYNDRINLAKVLFTKKVMLSLDVLNDMQEKLNTLVRAEKFVLLTNMGNKVSPTREAYDFYANEQRAIRIVREAFVLDSAALKIAANFYFKVKRPIIPSKVFEHEEAARNWLLKGSMD